jgi:hypothetical protein
MKDKLKKKSKPIELKARNAARPKRTERGPEPERLKVSGFANWEDAVEAALHKPKPRKGWPKK